MPLIIDVPARREKPALRAGGPFGYTGMGRSSDTDAGAQVAENAQAVQKGMDYQLTKARTIRAALSTMVPMARPLFGWFFSSSRAQCGSRNTRT
jgi:hypothetical protein